MREQAMRYLFLRRLLRNAIGVFACTLVFALFGVLIDGARSWASFGSFGSDDGTPTWSALGACSLAGAFCGLLAIAYTHWNESRPEGFPAKAEL